LHIHLDFLRPSRDSFYVQTVSPLYSSQLIPVENDIQKVNRRNLTLDVRRIKSQIKNLVHNFKRRLTFTMDNEVTYIEDSLYLTDTPNLKCSTKEIIAAVI